MKSKSTLYSRYFTYIKPVTRHPIIRNYGPTIFTLITITILVLFAIRPTVETILVLQKQLTNSEEVLQKITQKANDLSLGKKNYDNLDQITRDKISSAIPDNSSLKSIIQNLEQIAKAHDASISALAIQPFAIATKKENQVGSLATVSFTFNCEGSYNNLIAILQDLKTIKRLTSIDGVSLSKTTDGLSLIMSLSGKAYYLK